MSDEELQDVSVDGWHDAIATLPARGYTMFDWLSAVDRTYDEAAPGFDLVLRAIDISRARDLRAIRVRARVPATTAVTSVTDVYAGAAWHERETHEMFGIDFTDFDDGSGAGLRPLLLPDGFEGMPLRKSFVLAARAAKPWPGGKEPGEAHDSAKSPSRRRVQAPGVPGPEWGPR